MNDNPTYDVQTTSAEETKRVGAALAACLQPGDVVVLNGDLGAGKTQFVQGLAVALGVREAVTSPTFNILLSYPCSATDANSCPVASLNHFDLYRLEDEAELDDIGYWEVLEGDGATFIEWGDKFPDAMPDDYLEVAITAQADGTRTISACGHGPRSEDLLSAWRIACSTI